MASTILDELLDWAYSQAVGFLGAFFALMGNMGVELFDRGSVPLRPTFAGEKYLEAADAMLAASRRLEIQ